ncbi:MAG: DsbA family protein [Anaerolineales bacterium]
MAKKQDTKGKRQQIKEQRAKRQRQQRMTWILVITAGALVIAGLLIAPSLRNALTPVGEIVEITPEARPMADGKTLGDPNAPVLVEVWEDFQCPSCRTYSTDIEPAVVQNYVATGKVRYEFRHYPFLDDRAPTKESDQAANASMCAAEQDKFWEYHDYLFANWNSENAGAFSDKRLVAFAEALGLDMPAFNQCFQENRYKDVINEDLAAGTQAGVTGTPSVFVNGQIVKPGYVPSYEEIAAAIDAASASTNQ